MGTGFPCCPTVTVFGGAQLTAPCALVPRWLLDLFHNQIESKLQRTLESKVRMTEPCGGWAQVKIGPQAQRGQISHQRLRSWCASWGQNRGKTRETSSTVLDQSQRAHSGFLFCLFQICEAVQESVTSDLQPYLQTLPGREHPSPGQFIPINSYKSIYVSYKTLNGTEV